MELKDIPTGKVLLRKLDCNLGDIEKPVDIDKVLVEIEEREIIIDEETNTLINRDELEGKLKAGQVKKIRAMPPVRGG